MNKDIHVVFGDSAKGVLIQSGKFDLDTIQLICLHDALNLGPICDLYSVEEVRKRSNWWSKVFDDPEKMDEELTFTLINRDIETIKMLVANYKNEKPANYLLILPNARQGFCFMPFCSSARHFPSTCRHGRQSSKRWRRV